MCVCVCVCVGVGVCAWCVCLCVCVCCVGRWAAVGMDVCLRACGSASAVLAIPHSRDLYITVKLLIIFLIKLVAVVNCSL